ncbi:MAG TPA: 2TM domain-containing protein [Acidimicrobiales bacterium]|nr:2TM domain-containing protein [Acidimicrobiales bacterium]
MTGPQRGFQIHATVWFTVNAFLFMLWLITGAGFPWFLIPAAGWGIGLAAHATAAFTAPIRTDEELEPGETYRSLGS